MSSWLDQGERRAITLSSDTRAPRVEALLILGTDVDGRLAGTAGAIVALQSWVGVQLPTTEEVDKALRWWRGYADDLVDVHCARRVLVTERITDDEAREGFLNG